MTKVRHRSWPGEDGEIETRLIVYDVACASNWTSELDMRRGLPDYLSQTVYDSEWWMEFRTANTGRWRNIDGGPSQTFRGPDLSKAQTSALLEVAKEKRLANYGEAPWWVAFLGSGDLLTQLVLAGWVPSQEGLDLAQRARTVLDERT